MTILATSATLQLLLMAAAVFAVFYFLVQRPMRKRQQAATQALSSLAEGTRVLLTSGIIATVKHLGNKQAVVELAPGVEVTVLKHVIVRVVPGEEEEFEYADDASAESDEFSTSAAAGTMSATGGEPTGVAANDVSYPHGAMSDGSSADSEHPQPGI